MKIKVLIFGAGAAGLLAHDTLVQSHEVIAFADNDPNKRNAAIKGIPVISPEDIGKWQTDDILIASAAWCEITAQLIELGTPVKKITVFDPNYTQRRLDTSLLLNPQIGESLQFYILGKTDYLVRDWRMSFSEMAAMRGILSCLNPEVAVELGTFRGGSLSLIADYSEKTYSLDALSDSKTLLEKSYPNVDFVVGNTRQTLGPLIAGFNATKANVTFFLVDADHHRDAVRDDINDILAYQPQQETLILMHDSFHPECREGILSANWENCPHVHALELDFVHGSFSPHPAFHKQMWGGFALAVLSPESRTTPFKKTATHQALFEASLSTTK